MSPSLAPSQHEGRHHQRVHGDRGLNPLDRGVQVRDDLRDRDVHDARVEGHDELGRGQDGYGDPLAHGGGPAIVWPTTLLAMTDGSRSGGTREPRRRRWSAATSPRPGEGGGDHQQGRGRCGQHPRARRGRGQADPRARREGRPGPDRGGQAGARRARWHPGRGGLGGHPGLARAEARPICRRIRPRGRNRSRARPSSPRPSPSPSPPSRRASPRPRATATTPAERLVAMKLAVDGKDRGEIERELVAQVRRAGPLGPARRRPQPRLALVALRRLERSGRAVPRAPFVYLAMSWLQNSTTLPSGSVT